MDKEREGIGRRDFLLASGGAIFAMILPLNIAGADSGPASAQFIESTCKKVGKLSKRVLIAYASRCGSTGGVADAVGQVLCEMDAAVDVRRMKNVHDLSPYQAIIVGSAIRMGKWLPEAATFVKENQDILARLPVAFFVVCLTMKDDTSENRSKVLAYLDPVRKESPAVQPAAIGLFPGAVNFQKLSLAPKAILKMKGTPEGDFRDWRAINAWAEDVGASLLSTE